LEKVFNSLPLEVPG